MDNDKTKMCVENFSGYDETHPLVEAAKSFALELNKLIKKYNYYAIVYSVADSKTIQASAIISKETPPSVRGMFEAFGAGMAGTIEEANR